ncbi:hypothetical protein BpHYR1_036485 [Brachionus plicatilis]|uniref:Uncharacterized protein n=1 Tax=Brachionus plicatilis TaxID=10195 RepID=A0A3M7RUH7_BRAPC|nr:hypothetical protein BpHYR1_036485 [Brachionus plicatilis]
MVQHNRTREYGIYSNYLDAKIHVFEFLLIVKEIKNDQAFFSWNKNIWIIDSWDNVIKTVNSFPHVVIKTLAFATADEPTYDSP